MVATLKSSIDYITRVCVCECVCEWLPGGFLLWVSMSTSRFVQFLTTQTPLKALHQIHPIQSRHFLLPRAKYVNNLCDCDHIDTCRGCTMLLEERCANGQMNHRLSAPLVYSTIDSYHELCELFTLYLMVRRYL